MLLEFFARPGQGRAGRLEFGQPGGLAVLLDPQAVLQHVTLGLADGQGMLERSLGHGADIGRDASHHRLQRLHAFLTAVEQALHRIGQVEQAGKHALALQLAAPPEQEGRDGGQGQQAEQQGGAHRRLPGMSGPVCTSLPSSGNPKRGGPGRPRPA